MDERRKPRFYKNMRGTSIVLLRLKGAYTDVGCLFRGWFQAGQLVEETSRNASHGHTTPKQIDLCILTFVPNRRRKTPRDRRHRGQGWRWTFSTNIPFLPAGLEATRLRDRDPTLRENAAPGTAFHGVRDEGRWVMVEKNEGNWLSGRDSNGEAG